MKTLQKIKLINWYTFQNETIELTGNTLISGVNGSGKSTLLDAIQYVLSGGKKDFNQAANEKSKRSLETYIRGKVNIEGKEYIRPQDVTSYIVLEFGDPTRNTHELIGTIIEIPNASHNYDKIFFKIPNQSIDDALFIQNNAPITLSQFKYQNRQNSVELYSQKLEIQKMISSTLGLTGDKYFELLHKALAFKPINNINDFVNDFLLPESNISLDNLKQNVELFRQLQEIISQEEEKMQALTIIEESHKSYLKTKEDLEDQTYLTALLEQKMIEHTIAKRNQKNKDNTKKLNTTNNKLEELQKEKTILNKSMDTYKEQLAQNQEHQLYYKLSNEVKILKDSIHNLKSSYENYLQNFKSVRAKLAPFPWIVPLNKVDFSDTSTVRTALIEVDELAYQTKRNLGNQVSKQNDTVKTIQETLKKVENKLKLLKMNKLPYEENILNLQQEIKKQLEEKYHTTLEIRPVCEYLEIKNDHWRDAIEGYLNTQKFDLIIEPVYFDEALKIYDTIKKEKKIYGVGLVNTQKFKNSDQEVQPNTLAEHISSKNIYAKRYATYLLNRVTCCETVEELKNYNQAITPTCMTYRNHVARQINPKVYQDYYIGAYATKKKIEEGELALKCALEQEKQEKEKYEVLSKQYDLLNNANLHNLLQSIDCLSKYNEVTKEYETKQAQVQSLEGKGIFLDIAEKLKEFEQAEISLNNKIDELTKEKLGLEYQIETNTQEIADQEALLSTKELPPSHNSNTLTEYLETLFAKNTDQEVATKIENKLNQCKNSLNDTTHQIEILQNNYNLKFQFDEHATIDNIEIYMQELAKIREQDLVTHKSQVEEFKEKCQISFQEDFISRIKEKIETAQSEIKELNKSLKTNKFGHERYEFIYAPSIDPEMATYYNIITSGQNYSKKTLFEETLSVHDKEIMDTLFQKIAISNTKDNTQKILTNYTDYRRYMSYDIKVTNEEGDYYLFSKVSREKSGGEIQTPFYVMIAASFEQLLRNARRNTSVGCVVLFDEAFNNMDESRIEAMMNYYSKLNIQLLIAVPPSRIANIAPYVHTNLIINRISNTSYIKSFRVEELEPDV